MPERRNKSSFLLPFLLCCAAAFSAAVPLCSADDSPVRLVSSTAQHAQQHVVPVMPRAEQPWFGDRSIEYPEQLPCGYTVVLPGVFGRTPYNTKLLRLLKDAGTAVEYYDWTKGVPLFMRRGLARNRHNSASAREIACHIADYQDRYPDGQVHIIGLCAGAGVACEALSLLPPERAIASAVLLGPALSPDYDLRPALRGTQDGIDSFHSPLDIPVLMALTTVVGTMDAQHMPAAGAIGFFGQGRKLPSLRQHMYNPKMLAQGHLGGHFGWTAARFVDKNVIPILRRHETIRDVPGE